MLTRGASVVLLSFLLGWAAPSQAQGTLRVAYLSTLGDKEAAARIAAIAKHVEARWPAPARPGRAAIEYRTFRYDASATSGGDNAARIAEMIAWKPDAVFAPGALAAKAAAQATTTIPIVFGCKCNPLPDGWGLVKDPARPERNLTGFTRYHLDMVGEDPSRRLNLQRKRIELLQRASHAPVRRIAAIHGDAYDESKWRYEESARRLGVQWIPVRLDEGSIERLPAELRDKRVDAAIVLTDSFLDTHRERMVKASMASAVPVMFPWDEADAGAWMHYGTVVDVPEKAAEYIVHILQGRKVRDYPVEFPKRMELAVNFRTARAHGWEFPRGFLLLVDRAIE